MTAVERARKFIQTRGKAIAMTIVPLATLTLAATQQAKAVQLLQFNSGGCLVTGSGNNPISGGCLDTPIPGFQNGANSLKMTGSAFEQNLSIEGFTSMTFTSTGTASGGKIGDLPVSYDFNILTSAIPNFGGYSIFYNFFGSGGTVGWGAEGSLQFSQCGSGGSACATATGAHDVTFTGAVDHYTISLSIFVNIPQGAFLSVNIPGNSIDVNPQQVLTEGGVPEPASMVLGATGLLGLALARFRRRKA